MRRFNYQSPSLGVQAEPRTKALNLWQILAFILPRFSRDDLRAAVKSSMEGGLAASSPLIGEDKKKEAIIATSATPGAIGHGKTHYGYM